MIKRKQPKRGYALVQTQCWACKGKGKEKLQGKIEECYWCKGAGIIQNYEKLMLCLGGPLHMKYSHVTIADKQGYTQYNSGTRVNSSRRLPYGKKHKHSAVYIHADFLPV